MRRSSLSLTLCLSLLAALSISPAHGEATPGDNIKGTPIKIAQQNLSFSGHIQRLNAQLPVPWFDIEVSSNFVSQPWSFDGTYWAGVTDICNKYQCAVNFFAGSVRFETQKEYASLLHDGPFLFAITKTAQTPYLFMITEPHIVIKEARVTKATANGSDVPLEIETFNQDGPNGNIGIKWEMSATRDMTGPLLIELEADIIPRTTTLTVDAVQGATTSDGDLSVTVKELTNHSIMLDIKGGKTLSVSTSDPALEDLKERYGLGADFFHAIYKIEQFQPNTQFTVTVAKETKTQKFSLEFKDIDFKKLIKE